MGARERENMRAAPQRGDSRRVNFSIVTPVLNGMPWLPACVRSVEAQRAEVSVEHIILDGGSTDGSREWLRAHAALATVILAPDGGQSDAIDRGIRLATGDIAAWLNADDEYPAGALRAVEAAFEAHPDAVAVAGVCLATDSAGDITCVALPPRDCSLQGLLRSPNNPPQPSVFFRRAAYLACGGVDRRFDLAMDVDLWLKLAARGAILPLPAAVLSRFRVHPAAKSQRGAAAAAREDLSIRRRYGMPLLSPAGLTLLRDGYVYAVLRPVYRATVRPLLARLGRT